MSQCMWKGQEQCQECYSFTVNIEDKHIQIKVGDITIKGWDLNCRGGNKRYHLGKQQQNLTDRMAEMKRKTCEEGQPCHDFLPKPLKRSVYRELSFTTPSNSQDVEVRQM